MRHRACIAMIIQALLTLVAKPVQLAAQQTSYQFIDLGTFGGPTSYLSGGAVGNLVLSNSGIVGGYADTSTQDPYGSPNCYNEDCFVSNTFRWQNGTMSNLGAIANSSSMNGISQSGLIAGASENGQIDPLTGLPEVEAVLWSDQLGKLGTLPGGYESVATAVNDQGRVVGFAHNSVSDPFFGTQIRTFLWDQQNGMTDLGTLGGPDSPPVGTQKFCCANILINQSGQVAGSSFTNSTPNPVTGLPTTDPFLWTSPGPMQDLGTLGGNLGFPVCMNNRGQVVGQSNLAGDILFHPFLWDPKQGMRDLGTLGGSNGSASWINDVGDVVGWATAENGFAHAFLYRSATPTARGANRLIDLGVLSGYFSSFAYSINIKRQVVGCLPNTCSTAFLWENGQMSDLNDLIPPNSSLHLGVAFNINDSGWIVGLGLPPRCTNYDMCGHGFLLIPTEAQRAVPSKSRQ